MVRVVIAERHLGVRSRLKSLLEADPALALVHEAAFAGELLAGCRQAAWEVALLDVSLKDRGGQESLKALRRQCPALRLVGLTFALDYPFLVECLEAGAAGLLAAEDLVDEVLPAIHAVQAGETYLSRAVRAALDAGPGAP
jgi:DNA-binding NarL/FixJ family response regulator